MSKRNQKSKAAKTVNSSPQAEVPDKPEEQFGWKFHRFPLIAAIVVTTLFYIVVFIYVAVG